MRGFRPERLQAELLYQPISFFMCSEKCRTSTSRFWLRRVELNTWCKIVPNEASILIIADLLGRGVDHARRAYSSLQISRELGVRTNSLTLLSINLTYVV